MLEDILRAYIREKKIVAVRFTPPGSDAMRYAMQLKGAQRLWEACVVPLEQEQMLIVYVRTECRAAAEKRPEVANRLMAINYQLKLASFQMEPGTGEITVRACIYPFGTAGERTRLLDHALNLCGLAAESYVPGLEAFLAGGASSGGKSGG